MINYSVVLAGLIIFSMIPFIYAQELTIGQQARQASVQVEIDLEGNVHAKHVIYPMDMISSFPLIDGTMSNLTVKDQSGNELTYGVASGNNLQLFPSSDRIIVEYDLTNVVLFNDPYWTWNLEYPESVAVVFPHEVNFAYVNSNPINLVDSDGIKCHGCFMKLEYAISEPRIFQNVTWENNEFLVEIKTKSKLTNFSFNQPSKSISFDVENKNELVTVLIPLELLWEPYTVFLNNEKITQHEFTNSTHVWLTIKPENTGNVSIIGTTVIPEFPLIAPLVLAFSAIILMPFLGKVIRH